MQESFKDRLCILHIKKGCKLEYKEIIESKIPAALKQNEKGGVYLSQEEINLNLISRIEALESRSIGV